MLITIYLSAVAPCDVPMEPESNYPITPSSNPQDTDGLTKEDGEPWSPAPDDENPSLTITVSDEDTEIPLFEITETKNVKKVTVTVINQNDEPVRYFTTLKSKRLTAGIKKQKHLHSLLD